MSWRKYKECETCKNNKTSGWGFGIRKEDGCLFPKGLGENICISEKCNYYKSLN